MSGENGELEGREGTGVLMKRREGRERLVFGEKLKTESGGYQVVVERCLEEA